MAQPENQQEVTTISRSAPTQVTQTTKTITPPPVQTEHPQKVYDKKKTIFRTYQVIWYILGVVEIFLTFRILLKMFGANVNSPFVSLIYVATDPPTLPFRGIFGVSVGQEPALEWSTFVAMAVYAIIAYGLITVLQFMKPVTPEEVEKTVDNK